MARLEKELHPSIKYINELFTPGSEVQHGIQTESTEGDVSHMQVSGVEGGLVSFLMKMIGAKKVIEIGSLYGYSGSWILKALPKDGELHCFEMSPEFSAIIEKNLTNFEKELGTSKPRFKVHSGEALTNLKSVEASGPFDAVFIDADKANYPNYLTWAEKNVRKGGLIIGDNTFLFGQVYLPEKEMTDSKSRWNAMRDFNQRLSDRKKYNSILIPTAEGLTVAQVL